MNLTEIALLLDPMVDPDFAKPCKEYLDRFGLHCETKTFSPMTDAGSLTEYLAKSSDRGIKLFITIATLHSKLSAFVASRVVSPVIAVAAATPETGASETILATAHSADGVPIAVLGSGPLAAKNAAILAAEIMALTDTHLMDRLRFFKQNGCRFN